MNRDMMTSRTNHAARSISCRPRTQIQVLQRSPDLSLRPLAYASAALALMAGAVIGNHASAAGFQLSEHGARGLGRANAGEAAIGDTAAVLARNAAAITRLEGINVAGVLSYIDLQVEAEGTTTTPLGSFPAEDDNAGPDAFVPAFYSSYQLDDKLFVGFSVFSNFGLKTNYDDGFAGLDVADEASVETITITPSIAYKLNDHVSLGLGVDYVLGYAQLSSSVPRGFIPGVPGTPPLLDLEGDGDDVGYHVSALFEVSPQTRFGMQYRSSVDIEIEGDAESQVPVPFKVDGALDLNLPDIAEIAAYHEITNDWAIHGSINYTNWERFDSLIADIEGDPRSPITLKEENWNANMRYAVGVTHTLNERVILRGGFALDKSPVPKDNRTLSIPDSDRMWFSAGVSYLANESFSLDFGLARLEGDSVEATETSGLGNTVVADVEGSATIASVQVNAAF